MVNHPLSDSETTPAADDLSTRSGLSSKLKAFISLLVIGHLMAVFLPPLAFQASGPFGGSPSVNTLLRPLEGYAQFMYLDRGYAFFAPDPGPSHLIQAAIDANGQTVEMLYPDLNHQWPRLNYHRHFMLAEFLNEIYQSPGPPPELIKSNRAAADEWARLRERYERVRLSISDHLSHVNDGKDVKIRRIEHVIPTFVDYVQDPVALSDKRLYIVLLDQGVDALRRPPERIPPPAELKRPVEPTNNSESGDINGSRVNAPPTPAEAAEGADAASGEQATTSAEDAR